MEHQDALSVSVTDTAGKAILNIRLPAGALSEVATPAAPDRDLTECERDKHLDGYVAPLPPTARQGRR
jgi:hypothetical protein